MMRGDSETGGVALGFVVARYGENRGFGGRIVRYPKDAWPRYFQELGLPDTPRLRRECRANGLRVWRVRSELWIKVSGGCDRCPS